MGEQEFNVISVGPADSSTDVAKEQAGQIATTTKGAGLGGGGVPAVEAGRHGRV